MTCGASNIIPFSYIQHPTFVHLDGSAPSIDVEWILWFKTKALSATFRFPPGFVFNETLGGVRRMRGFFDPLRDRLSVLFGNDNKADD